MGQYKLGTVSVTNGSATVTVSGASSGAENVAVGDAFKLDRDGDAIYQIASRTPGSGAALTALTLSVPYAGPTVSGSPYQITADFTPHRGYPELAQGDADAADWITRSLRLIDLDVSDLFTGKANQATTYTKSEVDTSLAGKQTALGYTPVNKAGDTMTGTLTTNGVSCGDGAVSGLGGGVQAITGAGNFGVRIRAKADDSVAILQFTNHVVNAQWGVLNSYGSGAICMPFQPSYEGGRGSGQSFTASPTQLSFPDTIRNTGGHYNTVIGRFTCPVAGLYLINVALLTSYGTEAHDIRVGVYRNGLLAHIVANIGSGSNHPHLALSQALSAAVGDYFEIAIHGYGTQRSVHPDAGYNRLSIHLLG